MKLLYYSDLDTSSVKTQFKKVENQLKANDFSSADVKKMPNTNGFYRAKLDYENRLLFKFADYNGEKHLLLLEIILNHEYEKSRFLRGAEIDEQKFQPVEPQDIEKETDIEKLNYINERNSTFHILDKIISFDEDQHEIYKLSLPIIIIGSAGSGKTALTLEKMKHLRGNVAYFSLSSFLVENAQKIYYSKGYDNPDQSVDFLSFKDYLESIAIPKGKEINFTIFERWYGKYQQTYKFKEPYKLFEEFKGVMTGSVTDEAYLSKEAYLKLGVKQSIFLAEEREKVYDLFEKYLDFLAENEYYDSNMLAYHYLAKVVPSYDYVVIDEVQDITNIQLLLILKSLIEPTHFLLSGDSNQIVHPNFFSWSKIKSLFFQEDLKGNVIRILKTNYRNAQKITKLSNDLLKIKNARFGSIDKESTYLINTISKIEGEINFFEDGDAIKKDLNKKTEQSTKFAVLVMNNEEKQAVKKYFKTPLVFSIHEAKGLEYENIILVNFISNYNKEFKELISGVSEEDLLDENLRYSRSKDKTNKDLEAYKFYVNSLYVAFTRAVKNLYLIEQNKKHELLQLLGLVEVNKKLNLEQQASKEEDWLEESRRLELQGKHEQAQQIRDRLLGIEYLSLEQATALMEQIFSAEKPDPKDCQRLLNYAKARHKMDIIEQLQDKAKFGPAKQFFGEYKTVQRTFYQDCRNGNVKNVTKAITKFGVNLTDTNGMTGLMIGILHNKSAIIELLLKKEANLKQADRSGKITLHYVLLGYERKNYNAKVLLQLYDQFLIPFIKNKFDNRIVKINSNSMEFFLVNYIIALRDELINPNDPPSRQGLTMDEFMEYIEIIPESILPPHRKKRQYVNSILSKNEVDRDDKYNRKLFKRVSRGCYNLIDIKNISFE